MPKRESHEMPSPQVGPERSRRTPRSGPHRNEGVLSPFATSSRGGFCWVCPPVTCHPAGDYVELLGFGSSRCLLGWHSPQRQVHLPIRVLAPPRLPAPSSPQSKRAPSEPKHLSPGRRRGTNGAHEMNPRKGRRNRRTAIPHEGGRAPNCPKRKAAKRTRRPAARTPAPRRQQTRRMGPPSEASDRDQPEEWARTEPIRLSPTLSSPRAARPNTRRRGCAAPIQPAPSAQDAGPEPETCRQDAPRRTKHPNSPEERGPALTLTPSCPKSAPRRNQQVTKAGPPIRRVPSKAAPHSSIGSTAGLKWGRL
jgi:hypothetical protein